MALGLLLVSCRVEDELNSQNSEKATIQYGVSEQSFNSSIFTSSLNQSKIANAKNQKSSLSASDLLQRLDLEKAYLSSKDGQEVFHAPVRVFGNYKRSLLSVSKNHSSEVFLLTYPDPTNYRSFYITDLDGHLLKDVKIGDDGKEISQNQTAGKSGDACTQTVYVTCSSGEHSFEWGNAGSCTFWHNLSNGTPPTLFSVNMSCGEPTSGGGGSSGPVLEPGGFQGVGTGISTPPVGGGSPPRNLTPIQCIQGLDCTECNLPGDLDNDCSLNYDEARFQSFFTNLSGTEQQWLSNNTTIKNNFFVYLKNNSFSQNSLAFAFFGVDFFIQNPTTTWQQFQKWFINGQLNYQNSADVEFAGNLSALSHDLLIANQNNTLNQLQANWPNWEKIKQNIKNSIAQGVHQTAKVVKTYYDEVIDDPYINNAATRVVLNAYIDALRNEIKQTTNMNKDTMKWQDLFNIWLFELMPNPYSSISFTWNSNVINGNTLYNANTNAVYTFPKGDYEDPVTHDKTPLINKLKASLSNNSIGVGSILNGYFKYDFAQYYATLSNQNIGIQMLGSYPIRAKIISKGNGVAVVQFYIYNILGWDSATRFVQNGPKTIGFVPDKEIGEGLHLGGNLINTFTWEETIIY